MTEHHPHITLDKIDKAIADLANLGEPQKQAYQPILERLERERERYLRQGDAKSGHPGQ